MAMLATLPSSDLAIDIDSLAGVLRALAALVGLECGIDSGEGCSMPTGRVDFPAFCMA